MVKLGIFDNVYMYIKSEQFLDKQQFCKKKDLRSTVTHIT